MKLKRVGVCLGGVVLSFILMSIFVSMNIYFTEAGEFAKEGYLEKVKHDPTEDPYARLDKTIWRFNWIYNPAVVTLVSLFVAFLGRGRNNILLGLVAIVPFVLFNWFASSFSFAGIVFGCFYIGISILISILASRIFGDPSGFAKTV